MNNLSSKPLEGIELEAAEYVLGHIRGKERANIQRRLASDSELRHWVRWWEQRLFSLALHPIPEAPRKKVWERLQDRLFASHANEDTAVNGKRSQASSSQHSWSMRWLPTGLAAFVLVVLTAVSTLYVEQQLAPSREAPTHYASLESGGMISHIVERYPNGDIACIAVRPAMAVDQKVLELWAIADGTPVSLGVLPTTGKSMMNQPKPLQKIKGMLTLAVSVEPAGGSPTGLPTGPVVNTAKLVERNNAQAFSF